MTPPPGVPGWLAVMRQIEAQQAAGKSTPVLPSPVPPGDQLAQLEAEMARFGPKNPAGTVPAAAIRSDMHARRVLPGWLSRVLGVFTGTVAVLAFAALGGTSLPASAATPPLQVTLSACGTGSTAAWNSSNDPVLTAGTANAGTCGAPAGSTYDPAYAQVAIDGVSGIPTPPSEPFFSQSTYVAGSGDARLILDLNNGKSLTGYPPQAGLNGTDMAWAVGNSGTYTSYATAFAAVQGSSATVKDAYIVDDASDAGTALTLADVQFGGMSLGAGAVSVTDPGNQRTQVSTAVSLQVKASTTSSNGQGITFTATNLPTGLTISAGGLITGKPSVTGQFPVTVTATDAYGKSATTPPFTWTVTAAAPPPPPAGFVKAAKLTSPQLVIDDPDGSTVSGTKAQVWVQGGTPGGGNARNQSWQVNQLGNGGVSLQLKGTDMCLDVRNFGTTDGTKVQVWTCGAAGGTDQAWKPLAGGQLEAVNATKVSGQPMVLDDPARGGDGTQLQIWQSNGRVQQFWTLPAAA